MATDAVLLTKAREAQAETRLLLATMAERRLPSEAVERVLEQVTDVVLALESDAPAADVLTTARSALVTGTEIHDELRAGESLRRRDTWN